MTRYPLHAELALIDSRPLVDNALVIPLRVKVALLHAGWWTHPDARPPVAKLATVTGEDRARCSRFLAGNILLVRASLVKLASALDVPVQWIIAGNPHPAWWSPIYDEVVTAKGMAKPPAWVSRGMKNLDRWQPSQDVVLRLTRLEAIELMNCINHVLTGYAGRGKVVAAPINTLGEYINAAHLAAVDERLSRAFSSVYRDVSTPLPKGRSKRR